jgi:hypothetical protein
LHSTLYTLLIRASVFDKQTVKSKMQVKFFFVLIFFSFPESQSSQSCGSRSETAGLVVGGKEVKRGDWPWLVAFVHTQENLFFCGGSLISDRHVLSGERKGQIQELLLIDTKNETIFHKIYLIKNMLSTA